MSAKPTLAVFKFASCDGCQLSLLDAEDELLAVADAVDIAYFLEARTQTAPGPYDVGLVEGSITTAPSAGQRTASIPARNEPRPSRARTRIRLPGSKPSPASPGG